MESVVIIEPYSTGVVLVRRCREMGYRTIVLTYNAGQRKQSEAGLAHADRVEFVDTNDSIAVIARLVQLQTEENIRAVMPGFEYYVPLAAQAAEALGCPGLSTEHVFKVRMKNEMRAALRNAGLSYPKFRQVSKRSELESAALDVNFPAVLKPVNMAGSLGVRRINTFEDLVNTYDAMMAQEVTDLDLPLKRELLLEEYLSGPEFSVEGYVDEPNINIVSITEKILSAEPFFIEIGHIVQANIKPYSQAAIENYVAAVVRALHITLGLFHAEIRLTARGPVLIEIGARLPGDRICDLIQLSRGVDMFEIMVHAYTGKTLPHVETLSNRYAGITFYYNDNLRYYTDIVGKTELLRQPEFLQFQLLIPPNTPIPDTYDSESRVAYCICVADSYQRLWESLAKVWSYVQFVQ
jgi:biotin carboxylase